MRPIPASLMLCTYLLFAGSPALAAEPRAKSWDGLKEMMSAEEFRQAGLDKLSPEELSRLNAWLLRFIAYDAEAVVRSDEQVQELQKAPVRHRIVGTFRGWSGKTVFTLDNGEVWRQRTDGRYAITLENPEVEIQKNFLGFYELKIVQTGRRVGVSRVK